MQKPKIRHFLKINDEFINLVIRNSWFENRDELVKHCATIERNRRSIINIIVYFGVVFDLVFQTRKNSCMYIFSDSSRSLI